MYEEGPWVYKRNGLYYNVFAAECCSEFIAYSTAPGPTGPWTYRGAVMPRQGGSFTNHAGVVDFNGGSYFFYHNGGLAGGGGYTRSVTVEKFTYNADGTIPTINMTTAGVPQVGTLNPYTRQEAETIAWGVPGTGGWQTWTTVSCPVSGATGTHDLPAKPAAEHHLASAGLEGLPSFCGQEVQVGPSCPVVVVPARDRPAPVSSTNRAARCTTAVSSSWSRQTSSPSSHHDQEEVHHEEAAPRRPGSCHRARPPGGHLSGLRCGS